MQELLPHVSCVAEPHELEAAVQQGYKQIYVKTSKGIMKHHVLRGTNRHIRLKVDSIPGHTEVEIKESIQFLPAGKVPYELYKKVHAFFLAVMKRNAQALEAMVHILWNEELGYHIGVPPQRISKASVSYDWSYIPDGTSIIVDIHSHNTMGAFFSGTDNADDRNNISFSGVFGKLDQAEPATVWRFNYMDKKFDAKVEQIFEMQPMEETPVPKEWLDQVQIQMYQVSQGGNRGQGNVVSRPNYQGGRSWDALKDMKTRQEQPGRTIGTGSSINSAAANLANARSASDFPDAGWQSSFFDHQDDRPQTPEDISRDMEDYYRSLGIEVLPSSNMVDLLKSQGGYYDANKGHYVFPEEDEASMSGAQALSAEKDERAFVNVTEAEEISDVEGERLGKAWQGFPKSGTPDESDPQEMLPGYTNAHTEALAVIHGEEVAVAYEMIGDEMCLLEGKDVLLTELASDMFNLMSEEGQETAISELFSMLPERVKVKLQTNGL